MVSRQTVATIFTSFVACTLPSGVRADCEYRRVDMRGFAVASSTGGFLGLGRFNSCRQAMEDAGLTIQFIELPASGDDGKVRALVFAAFDFGNCDVLYTMGEATLEPTEHDGMYSVDCRSLIVGGTGLLTGASGKLRSRGIIHLSLGTSDWTTRGDLYIPKTRQPQTGRHGRSSEKRQNRRLVQFTPCRNHKGGLQ